MPSSCDSSPVMAMPMMCRPASSTGCRCACGSSTTIDLPLSSVQAWTIFQGLLSMACWMTLSHWIMGGQREYRPTGSQNFHKESMRIEHNDVVYNIVGGPAEIGDRRMYQEVMAERYAA